MYKDNLKEILTLGVFDYDAVVNMINTNYTGSSVSKGHKTPESGSAQSFISGIDFAKKQTPTSGLTIIYAENPCETDPNILNNMGRKTLLAWKRYYDCLNGCSMSNIVGSDEFNNNCFSFCCQADWDEQTRSCGVSDGELEPPGSILRNHPEPSFPCCPDCVAAKCKAATTHEDCALCDGCEPNQTLLTIAQTACYGDAYQRYINALICYQCANDMADDCRLKCQSIKPPGSQPPKDWLYSRIRCLNPGGSIGGEQM